ncbi:hypothetical protein D3C85_1389710 [compost metagenome]
MFVPEEPGTVSPTIVPRHEVVTFIGRPEFTAESSLGHDVKPEFFLTHQPIHDDTAGVHQRFRFSREGEVAVWDLTAVDGVPLDEVHHGEVHPTFGVDQREHLRYWDPA